MATLLEHCTAQIDSRIAGKSQATAGRLFSTEDHATATYVRDPGCWLADVDTSCISVWNSGGGNRWAGILITPRHIAMAAHWFPSGSLGPTGKTFRFVSMAGEVVERVVASYVVVAGTDIGIATLAEACPASIRPIRRFPASGWIKLPRVPSVPVVGILGGGYQTPDDWGGQYLHPNRVATVRTLVSYSGCTTPTDPKQLEMYWDAAIGGDSGNLLALVIDDELVMLSHWTTGGAGGGPDYSYHASAIDAALGTDATLFGYVDVSDYPDQLPPVIVYFTATPQVIDEPAEAVTLEWEVQGDVSSVTIDNEIGDVATSGTLEVAPSSTTMYTLTAIGPNGTETAVVFVGIRMDENMEYLFTGGVSGSMDDPANWTPNGIPTESDTALADHRYVTKQIESGTLVCPLTVMNGHQVKGGTFNAPVEFKTNVNGAAYGGTYNADVWFSGPPNMPCLVNGTYNAKVRLYSPAVIAAGAFVVNGPISFDDGAHWHYPQSDVDEAVAAQLAADQAAVAAAADKILRGNTILGTAGTLTKPSVGPTTIGIG